MMALHMSKDACIPGSSYGMIEKGIILGIQPNTWTIEKKYWMKLGLW
jgi:hypothetical protein